MIISLVITIICVGVYAVKAKGGDASDLRTLQDRTSAHVTRPACPGLRRGLAYYESRQRYWRKRMGAGTHSQDGVSAPSSVRVKADRSCPHVRSLVRLYRSRAQRARVRYKRWSHDYEWQRWLPAKFYRVARCETGMDWHFDSGTYVSAFGIIRVAFPSWTGQNTPREQYEVADSIRARYGWSAWGCGGA